MSCRRTLVFVTTVERVGIFCFRVKDIAMRTDVGGDEGNYQWIHDGRMDVFLCVFINLLIVVAGNLCVRFGRAKQEICGASSPIRIGAEPGSGRRPLSSVVQSVFVLLGPRQLDTNLHVKLPDVRKTTGLCEYVNA